MKDNDFKALELIAAQPFEYEIEESWIFQTCQYENIPLSEIFDLLEGAVETYNAIAPTLSKRLRESAEQEIDFFYSLIQKRLSSLIVQPNLLPVNSQWVMA
ncbi:MAG: hypothetical protein KME11_01615 [Timaviella obliquedivisa GSE-PSE-MK23-08B]|jgi:hypothetical protein|nr:hypothetical protein [Timaviella obliquedivisa GSE-PSE-MK23-08B]